MHLNPYHQQPPIPPTERRPGTVPSTSFNTWYVKCPEGLLQLLMPYLATSRIRKLYYKDTPQRRPQMIRAEWLAWVQNAPWVVQALMVQVWLHTHTQYLEMPQDIASAGRCACSASTPCLKQLYTCHGQLACVWCGM